MNKFIIALSLLSNICYKVNAQNKTHINFSYQYRNKTDSDNIKVIVKNTAPHKIFYYSIGIDGLADTGWVHLSSNVDALGKNDFFTLKPLKPQTQEFKYFSKKRILYLYAYYKISKVRFLLMYYEKPNLGLKAEYIYLPPM